LVAKYGAQIRDKVHWIGVRHHYRASSWWKDICGINVREDGSWFANNISRVVGNGLPTRFWLDVWVGNIPLCDRFPRLFSISSFKDGMVRVFLEELESWSRGDWGWRRRLFVWERSLLENLVALIPRLALSDVEDAWRWVVEESGVFTVKSAYLLLGNVFPSVSSFNDQELRIFNNIWKSPAPSKVIAFSWKVLRDRIPTRVNLVYRGVEVNGGVVSCVHCSRRAEEVVHLFIFCDFAMTVWKAIFRWLGLVIVLPPNLFLLFDCFLGAAGNKHTRHGYYLIWHATVWAIWCSRNKVIFSNGVIDPGEVVDKIKVLSWRWGMSRHKIPICLFYEWCWDPGVVMRYR
jgi:hypothetical protein